MKIYKKMVVPKLIYDDGYEVLHEINIDGEDGVDEEYATEQWMNNIRNKYDSQLDKPCENINVSIMFEDVYVEISKSKNKEETE